MWCHTDLREDPADISVRVVGTELLQQEFGRKTLRSEAGHSAAVVAVEDAVEGAAILTPGKKSARCIWSTLG